MTASAPRFHSKWSDNQIIQLSGIHQGDKLYSLWQIVDFYHMMSWKMFLHSHKKQYRSITQHNISVNIGWDRSRNSTESAYMCHTMPFKFPGRKDLGHLWLAYIRMSKTCPSHGHFCMESVPDPSCMDQTCNHCIWTKQVVYRANKLQTQDSL